MINEWSIERNPEMTEMNERGETKFIQYVPMTRWRILTRFKPIYTWCMIYMSFGYLMIIAMD